MPLQRRLLRCQQSHHTRFRCRRYLGASGPADLGPCRLLVRMPQQSGRPAQGGSNLGAQRAARIVVQYIRDLEIVDHMPRRPHISGTAVRCFDVRRCVVPVQAVRHG